MSTIHIPYVRFVAPLVWYNVAVRLERNLFMRPKQKREIRIYPIAKPARRMWDALTARLIMPSSNANLASLQPERSCSLRLNDDNEMLDRVSEEHPSSR